MQEFHMLKAIEEAKRSFDLDEVPIGAVIVDNSNGKIIASSGNKMQQESDPTLHAEMNVIKQACQIKKSPRLVGCDLYVTLEPCPMCAQAISFARIRRLYFGAYDPKGGGVEHGPRIFNSSSCHHKPDIYGGILEQQCGDLLRQYFQGKRV